MRSSQLALWNVDNIVGAILNTDKPLSEPMRRALLAVIAALKHECPKDYRRILFEIMKAENSPVKSPQSVVSVV